ncbi:CUB domain-containing protein, partial [Tenacibaculum sp. SDUM215027]|uniref:CUB domain-containing protein n=1 Tax=Tenacibaculum sp. SDUM215027 TaxID=3422596 RepID=UPI003D31E5E4
MEENYVSKISTYKKVFFFVLTVFLSAKSFAQTYNIGDTDVNGKTITTCSGTFTDSGGAFGDYGNGESNSVTFTSGNGGNLVFDFSSQFAIENNGGNNCWDTLTIYDGENASATKIGDFCSNNAPTVITSSGTSLHFVFNSDGSIMRGGWNASISCTAPIDLCDPVASGNPDTDGDGVSDICDLDDDNDGILDIDERPCYAFSENFGTGSGSPSSNHANVPSGSVDNIMVGTNADAGGRTWFQSNSGADATGNPEGKYLGLDNPNGSSPVLIYQETITVLPNEEYSYSFFAAAAREESAGPTSGYPDVRMQIKDGSGNILQIIDTGTLTLSWQRFEFLFTSTTTAVTVEIYNNNNSDAYNTLLLDEIFISLISCDSDGDGIPDYLDLDSDNDGCYDAIEGDENVTTNQLDVNGRIVGGVDEYGVPNLVNATGTADGSNNDQGQGAGTSAAVNTDAVPTLIITNPASVCSPSTVDLAASDITDGANGSSTSGTLTYWTDATATTSLTNYNAVASSGTYYIKLTSVSGCYEIEPVVVTINDLPSEATVSSNSPICPSEDAVFVINGNAGNNVTYNINGLGSTTVLIGVGGTVDVTVNAVTSDTTINLTNVSDGTCDRALSVSQTVKVNDTTAPVADTASLSDVTAECEVTSLTVPTATDNCGGSVTVTNDASLPITTQG